MKNKYFTKFCGITTVKDALNAQEAGCNALGFVFVKSSKRYIEINQCTKIINTVMPTMLIVGLFANNSREEVEEILKYCPLHVLQFHGDESAEFCQQFKMPYWKAIPMADKIDPIKYARNYASAQGYVIDNYGIKHSGGSGITFNWDCLPVELNNKWILAGGLNPKNIQLARTNTNIRCFDVSSGIEKTAGIKSNKKMKNFIKNLNKEND